MDSAVESSIKHLLYFILTDGTNNHCFGDSIQLPYTDATWEEQDEVLIEGATYVFTVVVDKPGRNKMATQQRVIILPGNPPQIKIK